MLPLNKKNPKQETHDHLRIAWMVGNYCVWFITHSNGRKQEMILIHYERKKYLIPKNFNELTGAQLMRIAGMIKAGAVNEMDLLRTLLNKSRIKFWCIAVDAKARMLPFVDWVFSANTLTAQLITSYKGYYAPKAEFDNLTLAEFHFTELFYKPAIDGDESALNELIAVLYRRPKPNYDFIKDIDGDARVEFNANVIPYNAKRIARLFPGEVKTAIMMLYDGCREHLKELYDDAFSAPGAQETADELGMYNLIRNLSGDRFGTIKEVEKVFVHTAFVEVEKIIEENKKTEAEIKRMK